MLPGSPLVSVRAAVEALKQQPQSPDKKIAFWTAYKTLADEFDKELQDKYGQDLDTSLIFVCTGFLPLFVSSEKF
jgi:hypothetical protein